jgi:hypothetical protein
LLAVQACVLGPLCSPLTQMEDDHGAGNDAGQRSDKHRRTIGRSDRIPTWDVLSVRRTSRRTGPERQDDQRFAVTQPLLYTLSIAVHHLAVADLVDVALATGITLTRLEEPGDDHPFLIAFQLRR